MVTGKMRFWKKLANLIYKKLLILLWTDMTFDVINIYLSLDLA